MLLTLGHEANTENGYVCICNSLSFSTLSQKSKEHALDHTGRYMLRRELCLSAVLIFLYKTSKLETHPFV